MKTKLKPNDLNIFIMVLMMESKPYDKIGQIVINDGKKYLFDDLGCLVSVVSE
ncbi:hypothetical protein [Paenibacillus sp. UNC451MF]|uniref:hypothetical protein n=1 Tax=Paenibacillus sp. UNC451MF TaxID=1449063 RepID=UPI000AB93C66|nr:hypothetical protein [Paenibacillus sp. UNC451MF]